MFWEASLSFNIVQLPTPSSSSPLPSPSPSPPPLPLSLSFFFSLSPSLSLSRSLSLSGVVSLSQALCSSDEYSNSLLHLDLSKNPGVLSGEDASVRERRKTHLETKTHTAPFLLHFISFIWLLSLSLSRFLVSVSRTCISSCLSPTAWSTWICRARIAPSTRWVFDVYVQRFKQNAFLWLTVSTLCLTQLFGALLRGCCADLSHLNLSKNSFSHRLVTSLRLLQQQQQQKKPNLRIYRPYFTSKASSCLSSSLPLVSFFAIISVSHLMGNQKWALWESLEHCASSLWVCPLRKAELAALPA